MKNESMNIFSCFMPWGITYRENEAILDINQKKSWVVDKNDKKKSLFVI